MVILSEQTQLAVSLLFRQTAPLYFIGLLQCCPSCLSELYNLFPIRYKLPTIIAIEYKYPR